MPALGLVQAWWRLVVRRVTPGQEAFGWMEPAGPSGRKVPARQRLVRDRPHTRIKLAAYQTYLPEWLKILGQSGGVRDLYVLDLFAGPGDYADGVAGSPVIAADAALVVLGFFAKKRRRAPHIHLRYVEKDGETRASLAATMERYRGRLDYQVLDGTAVERAPGLLAESRGCPTLALLDPDGIEIPFDLVRQFGHRPRTEVLLSFDVQALLRCAEIGDGPAVSRFMGDDVSWRRCYASDGSLDVDALMELYRQTLECDQLFRYASVQRIMFTRMHANRAIAQGCGSTKGTEKWLEAFRPAAGQFDATLVEVASQLHRRRTINLAIDQLKAFAGARDLAYGAIYRHLLSLNLGEGNTHQVLLFLRERGLMKWTSRLYRGAVPAPRFSFATDLPDVITWDGVERPPDMPELRLAARSRQSQ